MAGLAFRNSGSAIEPDFTREAGNTPFGIANVGHSHSPAFADIDGDGDLDLFIGNGDEGGTTIFYRNTAATPVAPVNTTTANGSYGTGDVINLTVGFSEAVFVDTTSGTPTLQLATVGFDPYAIYTSGSGTNVLTFQYTVQKGDYAKDLDQLSSTALALNTGTIKDADGNAANLTLAAPGETGSLAANADLVIDGTAPTISVALNDGGDGYINAEKDASVVISGTTSGVEDGQTVSIVVSDGSNTVKTSASVVSNSYSVSSIDLSTLNEGTLTITADVSNFAGNAAVQASNTTTKDISFPTVDAVYSSTANGSYGIGDVINLYVAFSEIVVGGTSGGTPALQLETGSTDRYATYTSGRSSNTLTFQYTVQEGDTSADLDQLSSSSLTLNGGSITDTAGNPAILTLTTPGNNGSLGTNADLVIDGVTPTVTSVDSATANGTYGIGDVINLTVGFSEAVLVDTSSGTPTLQLETGSSDRYATYASGSGSSTHSPSNTPSKKATTPKISISSPPLHSPSMGAASPMPLVIQPTSPSLLQVKPAPSAPVPIW